MQWGILSSSTEFKLLPRLQQHQLRLFFTVFIVIRSSASNIQTSLFFELFYEKWRKAYSRQIFQKIKKSRESNTVFYDFMDEDLDL